MTTEAPAVETTSTEAAPLSLDERMAQIVAESKPIIETAPTETPEGEEPTEAEKEPAKETPKPEDSPSAKMLRQKAASLTKLELDLAAKRGELATSEKLHAEKLAKADRFDTLMKRIAEDPAAAIEELVGENLSDFSEKLSRHLLGHDPKEKAVSNLEKKLAALEAERAAEKQAREEEAKQAEALAQNRAAVQKYVALVEGNADRWPSLARIHPAELVRAADDYALRMRALTGSLPSHEEISDALEPVAAKRIAERAPAPPVAKTAPKPVSKTLSPEAGVERSAKRELSLDEKLDAIVRESAQANRA